MNRNLLIGAVAAIAVAAGAFFLLGQKDPVTQVAEATAANASEAIDTSGITEMTLGDPSAPVTIVEYASFTCPHCRTFHQNVFKQLKADYIDTGKVKFVYREVYFDPYGLWAGVVARCGGGQRYFGLVDLIYENQSSWTQGEAAQVAGNLKRLGKLTGMDDATLDACLQDNDKMRALTALYQKNAEADGIRSTPSFVIDGKTYSNMSYEEMKAIIDAAL
ncbi:MAG: DsbA family protein [Paracoccaceae bacterium]